MTELFHLLTHASNCHGEITVWVPMLAGFVDGLPFIGAWVSALFGRLPKRGPDVSHPRG